MFKELTERERYIKTIDNKVLKAGSFIEYGKDDYSFASVGKDLYYRSNPEDKYHLMKKDFYKDKKR